MVIQFLLAGAVGFLITMRQWIRTKLGRLLSSEGRGRDGRA